MKRYTKTKVIRITETQHKTLVKMKFLNINTGDFIRDAIKEKIQKEHSYLIARKKHVKDPFSKSLDMAINKIN